MAMPNWTDRPFAMKHSVMPAMRNPARCDETRALAEAIVETIVDPLLVLDRHLRVVTANRAFFCKFKFNPQEVEGRPFRSLGNGLWNRPELSAMLATILQYTVSQTHEIETNDSHLGPCASRCSKKAIT